jgi:peptide/nickel transport system substrate-binding protein
MTFALGAGNQTELQLATFLQATAKSIGLNFKLRQMPATEFSSLFYDPTKRQDVDMVLTEGYLEIPDPVSYPLLAVPKGALFNWFNYDSPQATALLQQSRRSEDPVAAAEAYVQAQAHFEPDKVVIPIASPYELLFMNKRITGAPASFAYINMPWAAMIGAAGS